MNSKNNDSMTLVEHMLSSAVMIKGDFSRERESGRDWSRAF
jgi:hypothetical protein